MKKLKVTLINVEDTGDYILSRRPGWKKLKEYLVRNPNTTVFMRVNEEVNKARWTANTIYDHFDGWGYITKEKVEDHCLKFGIDFEWYSAKNERILRRCDKN